jgi:hypothetical protein
MRRASGAGILIPSMLMMLFAGTSLVSAEENIVYPAPRSIFLIALPIIGAASLLIYALPALLGRSYWREPPAFHIANVLTVSSLITVIATILIFLSLTGGADPLTLITLGVLTLLMVTGIFVRYLLLPLPWAATGAGSVAIIIFALAYTAMEASMSTIAWLVDVLLYTLPLWLLIWISLLLLETTKYHMTEDETYKRPDRPGIPRRRRMLRLGELLIMNMVIAVGVPLFFIFL